MKTMIRREVSPAMEVRLVPEARKLHIFGKAPYYKILLQQLTQDGLLIDPFSTSLRINIEKKNNLPLNFESVIKIVYKSKISLFHFVLHTDVALKMCSRNVLMCPAMTMLVSKLTQQQQVQTYYFNTILWIIITINTLFII